MTWGQGDGCWKCNLGEGTSREEEVAVDQTGDVAALDSVSGAVRQEKPDLRDVIEEAAARTGHCLVAWG